MRNIEAVAVLSLQAQTLLEEAIQAGLKRLPHAIERLRANPDTSVADLINTPSQPVTEILIQTDFVILTVYGLMQQTLEQIEELIENTPALRQAFEQGNLPWRPNDWRNEKKHVETYCLDRCELGGAGCIGWNLSGGVHFPKLGHWKSVDDLSYIINCKVAINDYIFAKRALNATGTNTNKTYNILEK